MKIQVSKKTYFLQKSSNILLGWCYFFNQLYTLPEWQTVKNSYWENHCQSKNVASCFANKDVRTM